MNIELIKTFRFEAAHVSPCGRSASKLHGHGYRVDVVVAGECDSHMGWLMDYAEIGDAFSDLHDQLDHRTLEEVAGLSDTSLSGIVAWLRSRLSDRIALLQEVRVSVAGDCRFNAMALDPDDAQGLPARVHFGFEAAHALPRVPEAHKCRRMHGHSFAVEVGTNGEDIEDVLREIYDKLDHRCLNEVEGLENPTSEMVGRWIWERLEERSADPAMVIVGETCTARCIYHGG
ncbi:MAG: 6-carboxytetrahydropterin synthase [Candidatus Hydrogenedentes bacterium]|nr:6-carboxytetrahydropterin synthase [Candidatus Hydrogenedentota bacterium]